MNVPSDLGGRPDGYVQGVETVDSSLDTTTNDSASHAYRCDVPSCPLTEWSHWRPVHIFHDFEEDFCIGHHYPNDYNRSIAPGLVRAAISHFPSADETIRSHPCPAESKNGPFTNIGQFLLRTLIGSANNSPVTPDTLDTKEADPDVKFDTFARNKSLSSVFIRKITPFTPYEVKTRTEELEKTGYARDALLWRTEMRHNTPCSVITGPESRITWLKDHLEMLDKDCERYNDPAKDDELRELDTLCAYF